MAQHHQHVAAAPSQQKLAVRPDASRKFVRRDTPFSPLTPKHTNRLQRCVPETQESPDASEKLRLHTCVPNQKRETRNEISVSPEESHRRHLTISKVFAPLRRFMAWVPCRYPPKGKPAK